MVKRVHSLKELKAAFKEATLSQGLSLSDQGQYAEAVPYLDQIKDFSTLDTECKSRVKVTYVTYGKELQNQGQLQHAISCFSRAREINPNDILLLERTRLLHRYRDYRCSTNIGEFRKCFGFGITTGGFDKYEYPFLEIAKKKGILQTPKTVARSPMIDAFETIGVYRTKAQGRHLLSQKIREYKGGNPSLALPFAWILADFVRSMTEIVRFIDVIVPSPSNPMKHLRRGFIPSLLIGKELSNCLAIPYRELFYVKPMDCRFRDMSYSEAKELVSYRVGRCHTIVSGRCVLVVDDIITSGKTLTLLADILKTTGASTVYAITLAKTGPPRKEV